MLTIRKEQVNILGETMRTRFESNAMKTLREKYTKKIERINDDELLAFVKYGIDKAAGYNIINRRDVLPYLEYMVYYGRDFDTDHINAWAGNILKIKNLDGEEKIRRLQSRNPLPPNAE